MTTKPKTPKVTVEQLKEMFHYDPQTGIFIRKPVEGTSSKIKEYNRRYTNKDAGRVRGDGYVLICINGQRSLAHRLAWAYMTGEHPSNTNVVDHDNRNPSDNRWANLRISDKPKNGYNRTKQANNTSGYKGVIFYKNIRAKQWCAGIVANGVRYRLGCYFTPEDAAKAYDAAAIKYHGEFACLNFPSEEN